jgi:hypothetical protein
VFHGTSLSGLCVAGRGWLHASSAAVCIYNVTVADPYD